MVFEVEPVEPLVARWARDVPMLAEGLPNCEEVQGFLKKMVSASNLWPQASRMPREELDTLAFEPFGWEDVRPRYRYWKLCHHRPQQWRLWQRRSDGSGGFNQLVTPGDPNGSWLRYLEVPESLTFEARAGGLVELSLEHGSNTTGVMLETEAVWNCLLFHCEILGVLGMLILSTWNMKSHNDMRRTTGFLVKNNPKALCHTCYWRFWHDSCCPANLREMRSFPSFVQLSCLLQSRILSFLGTPETLHW